MINIKYRYRNKTGLTQFKLKDRIRDACEIIANKLKIDIDTLVIILNEEKLNAKSKSTFEDIQNSDNLNNLNRNNIEMLFFDDPDKIIKVTVNYRGNKIETKAKKEGDNLYNILVNGFKLNISRMFFWKEGGQYKGKIYQKTFKI